jgi:membrane protease YdiL (CAAX protease family)
MSESKERTENGLFPVFCFFILTFAIFWGGAFAVYFLPELYYVQVQNGIVGILATILVGIPSFAPTISALIATGYFEGKTGLNHFAKSLIKIKVKYYWYLLVFFLPIFVYSLPIIFNIAISNPSNSDYFNTSLWSITLSTVLSNIVFAGFAEEPGWRGYALPKMNHHTRPIISGIIIGVLWALWHLPFYLLGSRPWGSFPQFVFTVTVISCIYTWIYQRTKSIPLMIIFHVMHNLSNTVFIKYHNPLWGGIIYFVILIVIIIRDSETLLKQNCPSKRGRPNL